MAIGYRSLFRVDNGIDPETFVEGHLRTWLEGKKSKRNSLLKTADWVGQGIHELGEGATLSVIRRHVDEGGSDLLLYRYAEKSDHGTFIVSIYVIASGELGTAGPNIVIDVSNPDLSPQDAVVEIGAPNIMPQILDSDRIFDGRTRLTGSPIVITEGNSSLLIDALTDSDRTVSVIVGASVASDVDDRWCEIAEKLAKQAVGTAAIFVVEADAVADIDAELGQSHAIGRGRFRTYAPRVDLNDPDDSIRHTWLGPTTLTRSLSVQPRIKVDESLQYLFASTPRRRLIERELPSNVTIAMALLHSAERVMLRRTSADRTVAEILTQSPAAAPAPVTAAPAARPMPAPAPGTAAAPARPIPGPARRPLRPTELDSHAVEAQDTEPRAVETDGFVRTFVLRVRGLVEKWLPRFRAEVSEVESESDLEKLIVRMGAEIEAIEEQILDLEITNEELHRELLQTRSDRDDKEEAITGIRNENVDLNNMVAMMGREIAIHNIELDYAKSADWLPPESMVELVARLSPGEQSHPAQDFVEFTGSPDGAEQMDDRYPLGQYTSTIWSYVKALYGYAEQKQMGYRGDFYMYLSSFEPGDKCPPAQYAAKESRSVRNNSGFRGARMLPVPQEIDPSGRTYMEAHYKPPHSDTFAPRVHFFDDTSGVTGKIYICYIGRHLPNTLTANV